MDLMPGIVDLTHPNYRDCEVYGKIGITNSVGCALTIISSVKATIDSVNYVKGAINVSNNVEEEPENE